MEHLISLFPERIAYAISNTVLHSFWQITLICIFYYILVKLNNDPSSRFKYRSALASLFLSLIAAITSFIYFYLGSAVEFSGIEASTLSTIAFSSYIRESGTFSLEQFLSNNQASIAALWLCGTLMLLARFIAGMIKLVTLRSSAIDCSDNRLSYLANTISTKLNIIKRVEIKESKLITTPMVLGHIKPVILFPFAVSTQLSMNEIEAILAHELAHVMRNDFILNLIQSITEVLLYFHPGIWWLSSIVRNERENCCDDIALEFVEDNLSYAKSLVKLQEIQLQSVPAFALAFSGSKNHLKNRVMRILNQSNPSSFLKEKLIAIALLFTFVLTFANNSTNDIELTTEVDCELEDVLAKAEFSNFSYSLMLEDDTIPDKNAIIIKKKNKSESIEVTMENGEITEMIIDGEVIPEDRYEEFSDRIQIDAGKGFAIPNQDFDFEEDEIISNMRSFSFSDEDGIINFNDSLDYEEIFGENAESIREALKQVEEFKFSDKFPQGFAYSFDFDSLMDSNSDQLNGVLEGLRLMEKTQEGHLSEMVKRFEMLELDSLLSNRLTKKNFPFRQGDSQRQLKLYEFNSPHGSENKFEYPFSKSKNNLKSKMTRELKEDDFLVKGQNKIELSGKQMKINGEKQPSNIWNKYKKLYERYVGAELNRDSKIVLEIQHDGKSKNSMKTI